jgi:predicted secreted protein
MIIIELALNMEGKEYSYLERRTMKFTHVLSILCVGIIAPYMIASQPADIEQAYKKEIAQVRQSKNKIVKEKKVKAQQKKAKKATKEKKSASSKKQTTKSVATGKKATFKKQRKEVKQEHAQEAQATEKTTRRTPNIQTLEPKTVFVGEEFTISRPASPNFGRTWKLHKALPAQIEMVGKEKFIPAEHPGKNEGTLVFTFKATKPGITSIEFEKIYPPELRDKKPMKIRIIPVEIKEAGTK